jgi:hypothetical protein
MLDDAAFPPGIDNPYGYLLYGPRTTRPVAPPPSGRPVRAQTVWFDPLVSARTPHHPNIQPHDRVNIYRLQDDSGRVWEYSRIIDRPDHGVALLHEMDRQARFLWDQLRPLALSLTRAMEQGVLRRIVDEGFRMRHGSRPRRGPSSAGAFVYWAVAGNRFDVARACVAQGWRILGTGVGEDRGNLLLESWEGPL